MGRKATENDFENMPRRRSIARERDASHWAKDDGRLLRYLDVLKRHVKPLLRHVRASVGRPWREILAEIDAQIRKQHLDAGLRRLVRARLLRAVPQNVLFDAKDGWLEGRYRFRCTLFVHPQHGTLEYQPRPPVRLP